MSFENGALPLRVSRGSFLIDALDECLIREGVCRVRNPMIRKLFSLYEQHKVHFFAISRPEQGLSARFSSGACVEIQASRENIERYVDVRMDELDALIKRKLEPKPDIRSSIMEAARGR